MRSIDDHFPDVILGKILRYCPHDVYTTLRCVSKRWNQVVDRFVGRVLIVKSGNKYIVDSESTLDKLSIKGNFWMTLCHAKEENDDKAKTEQLDAGDASRVEALASIPYGTFMRKMGCVGDMDNKSLRFFFVQCSNITALYLHLSVFLHVDSKDTIQTSSITTPHLMQLVIDSAGMNTDDSFFDYKSAFKNVAEFLEKNLFDRLKKFIFGLPYLDSVEGLIVHTVSNFLSKHSETITAFSFNQNYDASEDEEEENEDENDNESETSSSSSSFSYSNYLSLKQLASSAMQLKKLFLEELHIVLAHKQESGPLWKNLILHQTKLSKCIFAGDKIPCPVNSVECNANTLVTLRLEIRDGVNLECFRKCIRLRQLTLVGRKETDLDDEIDEQEKVNDEYQPTLQLRNAQCLPGSLESVELVNLRTHKDDMRIVCIELPDVRDLTLKNLGWEGNLGLRLIDLAKMWSMRRLDHFCIKSSLNMISYSELEEVGDVLPEVNLLACLVQSNSFAAANRFSLDVRKNDHGLYTTEKSRLDDLSRAMMMIDSDVFQIPTRVSLNEDEDEGEYDEEEEDNDDEEESDEDEEEEEGSEDGEEGDENNDHSKEGGE